MAFWNIVLDVILYCWNFFFGWLVIFAVPFTDMDFLWMLIPVWISWFFSEFFQEKKGTSFGNAISNGVVPLFVGFSWIQYLVGVPLKANIPLWVTVVNYTLCGIVIIYGILIIYFGIKGYEFIKYMGRIREVTYVLVVFTPLIYGLVAFEWEFFVRIIVFFPLFYYLIEWIDAIVPDPDAVKKDLGTSNTPITSPRDLFDSSGANFNQDYTNNQSNSFNNPSQYDPNNQGANQNYNDQNYKY